MTDVEQLSAEVQQLRREVRALLDLWEQAKGVLTFIRWAAWIGGIIGGGILFLKPYLK